jgi:ubiquinone/menaquinone biosynthesis C-methylase UbiE
MKRSPLSHEAIFSSPAYAEAYARGHRSMAEGFGFQVAERLGRGGFEKGRILDAGCGFGATLLILAERFPESEVVGIDLSEPLLSMARGAAEAAGLGERARFESGDVQAIPYEDRSFDAVLSINMLHLVDDPLGMLNEIERVLAPGGYAFNSDLRRSWLGLVEKEIRSALSAAEARELIGRSGLQKGSFTAGLLYWRYETPA